MPGRVCHIGVSKGGVPKLAVPEARVLREGIEGDWQKNRVHHGGPERAVCLFSLEIIQTLQSEGHPIAPGTAGDNLTLSGLDWKEIVPGTRLNIGSSLELQVVSYTSPCSTIRASFKDLAFGRISQKTHPGESRVYARVLREGTVRVGDGARVVPAELD